MASPSEKARKKLERLSNYFIDIIKGTNMGNRQKMLLIRSALNSDTNVFQNFNSIMKEYFNTNQDELKNMKSTEEETMLDIEVKYNFGCELSVTKVYDCLKKAINNLHNAVLSAKNRNTTNNKLAINKCYQEIKYLIKQEEKINTVSATPVRKNIMNNKILDKLSIIQSKVLKLSDILKNIENDIKDSEKKYFQKDNVSSESSECKQIFDKINKSVTERETSINSLIVLQSNINTLKISLKQKSAFENKFEPETYNLNTKNVVKIQHYIPQFFQRNWKNQIQSNSDKKEESLLRIYKYEKKKNLFSTTTIKNCCQEKNLYEPNKSKPNNYFEKQYCKLEGEISHKIFETIGMIEKMIFKDENPQIEKINNNMQILQEQKEILIRFFAHLSSRHPQSVYGDISHINHINDYLLTSTQKQIHNYNNLNKESKSRLVLNYLALEDNRFENRLKDYKLQVFISDQPDIFFCDNITSKIVTQDNEYFLPLTPYILIWFTKNIFITDKKILPINKSIYEKFVKTYFNNPAVNEIYGINQQYLDIVKKIAEK